jgi:hypothetical protein
MKFSININLYSKTLLKRGAGSERNTGLLRAR